MIILPNGQVVHPQSVTGPQSIDQLNLQNRQLANQMLVAQMRERQLAEDIRARERMNAAQLGSIERRQSADIGFRKEEGAAERTTRDALERLRLGNLYDIEGRRINTENERIKALSKQAEERNQAALDSQRMQLMGQAWLNSQLTRGERAAALSLLDKYDTQVTQRNRAAKLVDPAAFNRAVMNAAIRRRIEEQTDAGIRKRIMGEAVAEVRKAILEENPDIAYKDAGADTPPSYEELQNGYYVKNPKTVGITLELPKVPAIAENLLKDMGGSGSAEQDIAALQRILGRQVAQDQAVAGTPATGGGAVSGRPQAGAAKQSTQAGAGTRPIYGAGWEQPSGMPAYRVMDQSVNAIRQRAAAPATSTAPSTAGGGAEAPANVTTIRAAADPGAPAGSRLAGISGLPEVTGLESSALQTMIDSGLGVGPKWEGGPVQGSDYTNTGVEIPQSQLPLGPDPEWGFRGGSDVTNTGRPIEAIRNLQGGVPDYGFSVSPAGGGGYFLPPPNRPWGDLGIGRPVPSPYQGPVIGSPSDWVRANEIARGTTQFQ